MSWSVGENIGPYQLLEQIGEGGMGTVFKAYHPALDRLVALKIIHPAFREEQTFIARFQREARLVAKLEHPNIVPIYDYSEYEKVAYLVMKFIEGSTLKGRLTLGPLNSYEILQVVDSVGLALAYAHSQGVLHRDIKPSNVLIGVNGMIYLADFGLARILQAEGSTLSTESTLGTPDYVSPEQAMGRQDLDTRTDIYSYGVMLYELVVGQTPFDAKTGYAIIHDHIYTLPRLPRTLNPHLSESVEQVLLKALAKDPDDRFDTVDQMMLAFKTAWLNADNATQRIASSGAFMPYRSATANEHLLAEKPASHRKKRREWLYILLGIAVGIVLAFSLVPDLRGRLMAALSLVKIPAVFFESTPTGQALDSTAIAASPPSPVSQPTNNTPVPGTTGTAVPNPTGRTTESPQIILTPPPIIDTVVDQVTDAPSVIETVVDQVTDVPQILPPLPPVLP